MVGAPGAARVPGLHRTARRPPRGGAPHRQGFTGLDRAVQGPGTATDIGTLRALDSAFHLDRLDFDVALASTQRAHRRVLAAIAEGNAKMAERRMAAHLADSGREIAEVYARFTEA